MAKRGENLVSGPEIFVDRLRLGRRFNNDDIHAIPMGYPPYAATYQAESASASARNMVKAIRPVKSGSI
jgi:hypothetical protein